MTDKVGNDCLSGSTVAGKQEWSHHIHHKMFCGIVPSNNVKHRTTKQKKCVCPLLFKKLLDSTISH